MKIMVIDDSFIMLQIISKALRVCGYSDIVTFQNPVEALENLTRAGGIGLVLCDWNMPGMTGLQILKEIRKNPRTQQVPFFMVTSRGTQQDLMEALKAGVTNYIVKPIQETDLKEKLKTLEKDLGTHTDSE